METEEKIRMITLDELIPLIGEKVIAEGKEIGLLLTKSGTIHAIHNICSYKQGPLSKRAAGGEYTFCSFHD